MDEKMAGKTKQDDEQLLVYRKAKISQRMMISSNTAARDLQLQFKKRCALPKTGHHKRTLTDNANTKKDEIPSAKRQGRKFSFFDNNKDDKQQVQIIEELDIPSVEEDKRDTRRSVQTEDRTRDEKIKKQIEEAEDLVAKFSQNAELFAESGDELNMSMYGSNAADEEHETEMEITVGSIRSDIAVVVTKDSFLIVWPIEMLPKDVKKGDKYSILIKRNINSEVLRENSLWTMQSQISAKLDEIK